MIKLCQKCPAVSIPKLPLVTKCCFCIPVRKGVILFGYVNIVFCLLSYPLVIFLLIGELTSTHPAGSTDLNFIMNPIVQLTLAIALNTIDVIMTIVVLIGAHKKKRLLLKAYLYVGVVFQIVILSFDISYISLREYFEIALYFIISCLNFYMLFLVYNIVRDIDEISEVQYVSHRDAHAL